MSKRARDGSTEGAATDSASTATDSANAATEGANAWSEHKIVLNVGGRRFETTTSLLQQKTTYFKGMFDSATPSQEVFVDRDPEAFAMLLRFLRHGIVARSLPRGDPDLCAAVLAEADFFGVEALLQPVKAAAHRNMQPSTSRMGAISQQNLIENMEHAKRMLDDHAAADAFDKDVGSIVEAIEKGVLPTRFFGPPRRTIQSLVPPSSTCWAQIGFISHEVNGFDEDNLDPAIDDFPYQPMGNGDFTPVGDVEPNAFDEGQDLPMSYWAPACVRRVAYFATVDVDGLQRVEPEAVILLSDEDQHAWMRNGKLVDGTLPASSNSGDIDPRPFVDALSHGQRLMLLSDYITSPCFEQLFCPGRDCDCDDHDPSMIWTKLVFMTKPPLKATWLLRPPHPGCEHPVHDPRHDHD